jgi:hypothetical protein
VVSVKRVVTGSVLCFIEHGEVWPKQDTGEELRSCLIVSSGVLSLDYRSNMEYLDRKHGATGAGDSSAHGQSLDRHD